jgi:hypothetical protein
MTRMLGLSIVCLMMAATVPLPAGSAPPQAARTVSGHWAMTLTMEVGTAAPTLTISQDGDRITGTYKGRYGEFPIAGHVKDRTITFSFLMRADTDQPASICFEGELTADATRMSGTADMADIGPAKWTATKTAPPNK